MGGHDHRPDKLSFPGHDTNGLRHAGGKLDVPVLSLLGLLVRHVRLGVLDD